MRSLGLLPCLLAAVGCADSGETVTVYLEQRLGPDGPPGQVAPVLEPVERERREELLPARQVLVQLRQGPTPNERARGFEPTLPARPRVPRVRVVGGTAFVDGLVLRDLYALAALVYSLTELRGVERVRVCCHERHDGTHAFVHTRADFRFWQGEPCELRTTATHMRCLRDR